MKKTTELKIKLFGYFFMVLLTSFTMISNLVNWLVYSTPIDTFDMISTVSLFVIFSSMLSQNIKKLKY